VVVFVVRAGPVVTGLPPPIFGGVSNRNDNKRFRLRASQCSCTVDRFNNNNNCFEENTRHFERLPPNTRTCEKSLRIVEGPRKSPMSISRMCCVLSAAATSRKKRFIFGFRFTACQTFRCLFFHAIVSSKQKGCRVGTHVSVCVCVCVLVFVHIIQ